MTRRYARALQGSTSHPHMRIRAGIHIGPMHVEVGDALLETTGILGVLAVFTSTPTPDDNDVESPILTEAELRQHEQRNLLGALTRSGWKIHGQGGAAELLGIKPTTLISRIKKLGLKKPA